ncbi:MAG: DNA polymerase III subunit gamma/tau [Patescibacteria group bacterium]|nr:DNA polymerase III subunit gamma/tau [Patescibacteria group bacterium]
MPTLYRKYRPQNFKEVVGQNHIKVTLEQEIKSGKVAHAYLFCGPRAVGKTTLARVLAKAINCEKRETASAEPCDKCLSCKEITGGRALDVMEIDAASYTQVENVRENIIPNARVTPARSKYKVFIIDEVHMLTMQAFNALLKIIEEPPVYVVFILCTTEAHKVPLTIISRCQRFDFKRISVNDVVKKLAYIVQSENVKVDKGILEAVARHADGHMRDAESMLGQIIAIGGESITQAEADLVIPRSDLNEVINLLNLLVKKDAAGGIRLINQLMDDGVDLKMFLKNMIEILRKLMIIKINPGLAEKLSLEMGEAMELKINQLARELNVEQILKIMEKLIKAAADLKADFIKQLSLEMAIVEICALPAPSSLRIIPRDAVAQKFTAYRTAANSAKPVADKIGAVETPINVTDSQIMEKWNEVLAKVKQYNHSLSFILRVCQPKNLTGNQLCLAFKYKFHRDRVSEAAVKNIIEKVLNQVYGAPLVIEAMIDENLEVAASKLISDEPVDLKQPAALNESASAKATADKQGNMIDNLLKTFGGKVVS